MKNLLQGMNKLIDWLDDRDWVILPFYVVGSLVHAAIVIVTGMFSFIFFKTIQIWESVKPEIVLFFKKKNKIEQK